MWRADLMLYELDKASYGCTEEALDFKIHPDHWAVKIYLTILDELDHEDAQKNLKDLEKWREIHQNIIEKLSSCYNEKPASAKSDAARRAAKQWLSRVREAEFEKRVRERELKEQGLPAGDGPASASPTGVRSRDKARKIVTTQDQKIFPAENADRLADTRGAVDKMGQKVFRGVSSSIKSVFKALAEEYQEEVQEKLKAIKDEDVKEKIQNKLQEMIDIFV